MQAKVMIMRVQELARREAIHKVSLDLQMVLMIRNRTKRQRMMRMTFQKMTTIAASSCKTMTKEMSVVSPPPCTARCVPTSLSENP
jgi:hypothetical protein